MGRDDPDRYSDEDVALILRKATELAGQSDVRGDAAGDLSLEEIKAIGGEVGIDPALIEQAARLVPRRRAETVFERLIGGPSRHRIDARFPTALTQESATHLLSAVRAETDRQGQGQADAAGMSWHSEQGASKVSVTAHSDQDGTTVRVAVDRTQTFLQSAVFVLMLIFLWFWFNAEDVASLSDLIVLLGVPVGGLAAARALWASSTRAIEERATALLGTVSRSLADSSGESGAE